MKDEPNQTNPQNRSVTDKYQRLACWMGATIFYLVALGLHFVLGLLGEYLNNLGGGLVAELPFWGAQFVIILVVILPLIAHLSQPSVKEEIKASSLWRISQAIRGGFTKPFRYILKLANKQS